MKIYPNALTENKNNYIDGIRDSCFISIEKESHHSLYAVNNLDGLSISDFYKSKNEVMTTFIIRTVFCDACEKRSKFLVYLYVQY
jgi:hypothetical protein